MWTCGGCKIIAPTAYIMECALDGHVEGVATGSSHTSDGVPGHGTSLQAGYTCLPGTDEGASNSY